MAKVDSIVEGVTRKIWYLPNTFPRAGLHAPPEELGLNIPTIWEDYLGGDIKVFNKRIYTIYFHLVNAPSPQDTHPEARLTSHTTYNGGGFWLAYNKYAQ
jgi:hypothetical protein